MPRLYLQRGLSSRVVQAVSERLEQILAMASDGVARTRSRSPIRVDEARSLGDGSMGTGVPGADGDATVNMGAPGQPEGTLPEGTVLDTMAAAPPGEEAVGPNPSEPEIWKQTLEKVLTKLQGTSFELSASIDAFVDHQDKLRSELSALAAKMDKQSAALTTVGASMSSEVVEINKLLRAFDKFASLFKWTFSGQNTVEGNMALLQQTMKENKAELESAMVAAFSQMTTLLEKIAENTKKGDGLPSEAAPFPPPAPETPGPVRSMEPGGTSVPAGPVGGSLPGSMMPGYASGVASFGGASVNDPAVAGAANPGTGSVPPPHGGKSTTGPRELTSTFVCFCAEVPGGTRNSGPSRIEVPCPRAGVYTRDRTSGQLRVLSPTGYDRAQAARITATWAPKGIAALHDGTGTESLRRVY